MAGSTDYSLVCDITIPSLSDTPPSVTWTLSSHTTQTGSAVASGGQSYVSRLPLTPVTHDDEGDYTCTAEYTENGATYSASDTYYITVGEYKLLSLSPLPLKLSPGVVEMSVEVRGSGRGRVGVVYTLTCTVTLSHRARDSSVSIQWQGQSADEQTTDDTTGNRVVTRHLSLDPLTLAHGGTYTCTAQYIVKGVEITTESGSETVTIDGMKLIVALCMFISIFP